MTAAPRKPWYGSGRQPFDDIVEVGWMPEFAAGNVLKYLRRTKDPEHSIESARWYHTRLLETARNISSEDAARCRTVLRQLFGMLTEDEQRLLTIVMEK